MEKRERETGTYRGLFFNVLTRNSCKSMPVESVYSWLQSEKTYITNSFILKSKNNFIPSYGIKFLSLQLSSEVPNL